MLAMFIAFLLILFAFVGSVEFGKVVVSVAKNAQLINMIKNIFAFLSSSKRIEPQFQVDDIVRIVDHATLDPLNTYRVIEVSVFKVAMVLRYGTRCFLPFEDIELVSRNNKAVKLATPIEGEIEAGDLVQVSVPNTGLSIGEVLVVKTKSNFAGSFLSSCGRYLPIEFCCLIKKGKKTEEPEPKFKVNDIVRVLRNTLNALHPNGSHLFEPLETFRIKGFERTDYVITHGNEHRLLQSDIELVSRDGKPVKLATPIEGKIEVGDLVQIVSYLEGCYRPADENQLLTVGDTVRVLAISDDLICYKVSYRCDGFFNIDRCQLIKKHS